MKRSSILYLKIFHHNYIHLFLLKVNQRLFWIRIGKWLKGVFLLLRYCLSGRNLPIEHTTWDFYCGMIKQFPNSLHPWRQDCTWKGGYCYNNKYSKKWFHFNNYLFVFHFCHQLYFLFHVFLLFLVTHVTLGNGEIC